MALRTLSCESHASGEEKQRVQTLFQTAVWMDVLLAARAPSVYLGLTVEIREMTFSLLGLTLGLYVRAVA